MRVWVYPEKVHEELGKRRYEVEWHEVTKKAMERVAAAEARGEQDEYDPDCDIDTYTRTFPAKGKCLAMAFAKKMAECERSAYGSAIVTEQEVGWYVEEDRIAEWVNVGEHEYV